MSIFGNIYSTKEKIIIQLYKYFLSRKKSYLCTEHEKLSEKQMSFSLSVMKKL